MEKRRFEDPVTSKAIVDHVCKIDQKSTGLLGYGCAEHVLPLFEKAYSNDKRPRKALEAGRVLQRPPTWLGHAIHAATYAAKASEERQWQLQHLLDLGDHN